MTGNDDSASELGLTTRWPEHKPSHPTGRIFIEPARIGYPQGKERYFTCL